MTVGSTSARFNEIAGADTTGPFTYTFRILAEADLVVVKIDADGEATTPTVASISGVGDAGGGEIYTTEAIEVGATLRLYSAIAPTQETAYLSGDAFPSAAHETALDKLTLIVQDHARDIARSMKVDMGDTPPELGTRQEGPFAGRC